MTIVQLWFSLRGKGFVGANAVLSLDWLKSHILKIIYNSSIFPVFNEAVSLTLVQKSLFFENLSKEDSDSLLQGAQIDRKYK